LGRRREQDRSQASQDARRTLLQNDFIQNFRGSEALSPYSQRFEGPSQHTRDMAGDRGVNSRLWDRYAFEYDPLSPNSNDPSQQFRADLLPTRTPDFTSINKALKPGLWERLAGYGSIALGLPEAIKRQRGDEDEE